MNRKTMIKTITKSLGTGTLVSISRKRVTKAGSDGGKDVFLMSDGKPLKSQPRVVNGTVVAVTSHGVAVRDKFNEFFTFNDIITGNIVISTR